MRRSPPHMRRSPEHTRPRVHRRRAHEKSLEKSGKPPLALSDLDFSKRTPDEELDQEIEYEPPRTTCVDESDVAPLVPSIARTLSSLRLSDRAPLAEIHLAYNQMGDDGIGSIAWAARQGSLVCLTRLVLTGNRLSRLPGLASVLRSGLLPSLKILYLSSNRITAEVASELASATLSTGSSALKDLSQLWLDHNMLGEETQGLRGSVEAIATIAAACPSLDVLSLGSNGLGDAHLQRLTAEIASGTAFSARPSGKKMARLDVTMNNFSMDAIKDLEAACVARGAVRAVA